MSDYPVPHYAAHIWVVGNQIKVGLPPIEGHQQSHTVSVPWTEKGLGIVLRMLRDRESQRQPHFVGTQAALTQYQVEELMRAMKKPITRLTPASVADLLELDLPTEDVEVKETT